MKPVAGSLSGGSGTFTPSTGFTTANLSVSGDTTHPMKCMVTRDANSSGKDIIFCLGQQPTSGAAANNVYSLLLVQK